jgi:hypothetical protein
MIFMKIYSQQSPAMIHKILFPKNLQDLSNEFSNLVPI